MASIVLGLFVLGAPAIRAQAPPLEFASATVKLHPIPPGSYLIKNYTHAPPFVIPTSPKFTDTAHARDFIMEAYGVSEYQILYLPAWALSRDGLVFDIEAEAPGGTTPTPAQFQQMLQSLLASRFQLKVHWETKPKFSINALVVDKNGPKFHEFHDDGHPASAQTGSPPFAGTTIFALAHFLSQNLDYPVLDRTGLKDVPYDFDIDKMLDFHEVDREQGADPMEAQDYLRTAVQHELGLRLEPKKVSMQVLSIDHIEEPSSK